MRALLFIFLILFSMPIMLLEPRYTVDLGSPIQEELKAPESNPRIKQSYSDTWSEHDCLSHSMYWESKGKQEGKLGMILVGLVIMNRVHSDKGYFPNSICEVVKKPKAFSFFWDGKSDVPKERDRFELAKTIADEILIGKYKGLIPENVLYFKRCNTFSQFFEKLEFYKRHSSHCFYIY